MADFAVVQQDAPTVLDATVDFTESGFGTPQGAIFFMTRGTSNGNHVANALLCIGATDGTRSRALSGSSESGIVTPTLSDTFNNDSTTQCIFVTDSTTGTKDGAAIFDAWITDGVRIRCTDAFPNTYKINGILIGGTGVSDVYVNHASTPGVVDTATVITTVPFQADVVFCFSHLGSINDAASAPNAISFGCVVNDGANTQRSASFNDADNVNPTTCSLVLDTSSVIRRAASGSGGPEAEITTFTSSGFSLYQRFLTNVIEVAYVAIKLNSIAAKLVTSASSTTAAPYTETIAGAGFTPQFGLMFHTSCPNISTVYTDGSAEVLGISAFTAAASCCAAITCDDAVTTTNTESITDYGTTTSGIPVNLRKDGATFMKATFSAFTSDGVIFDYSTTNPASVRQRAVLFVQENTGPASVLLAGSAATSSRGTTAPNFEIPL